MNALHNLILNTDSYKASHYLQYPEGTTQLFSYIESRGGKYPATLFFGLQMFIKEYLTKPITQEMIDHAEKFFLAHGEPFNREGWEYILHEHNGYLPILIKAVPEGSVVPVKNVLVTVENTDPNCAWVVSYIETGLLRATWYPTTVATNSFFIKKNIMRYLKETGDVNGIGFKLHDFGARGVSSNEGAAIGGASHLVNFLGTDTVIGAIAAMEYYNTDQVPAFSIPAAEHSTITIWGKENEVEAYRNMLKQFAKPGSLVAVVSDSYDIYNATENLWGEELREEVINSGATVVVRPDSGHPATVVLEVAHLLDKKFGSTVNEKGYKVLNNVRIIQGDGINETSIIEIMENLKNAGFSIDNIAFGMGAGMLQKMDRDTQKFAMKASAGIINGREVEVFKDPITDKGKISKKGRLNLLRHKTDGTFVTIRENSPMAKSLEELREFDIALIPVYKNGKVLVEYTFEEVRERASSYA